MKTLFASILLIASALLANPPAKIVYVSGKSITEAKGITLSRPDSTKETMFADTKIFVVAYRSVSDSETITVGDPMMASLLSEFIKPLELTCAIYSAIMSAGESDECLVYYEDLSENPLDTNAMRLKAVNAFAEYTKCGESGHETCTIPGFHQ